MFRQRSPHLSRHHQPGFADRRRRRDQCRVRAVSHLLEQNRAAQDLPRPHPALASAVAGDSGVKPETAGHRSDAIAPTELMRFLWPGAFAHRAQAFSETLFPDPDEPDLSPSLVWQIDFAERPWSGCYVWVNLFAGGPSSKLPDDIVTRDGSCSPCCWCCIGPLHTSTRLVWNSLPMRAGSAFRITSDRHCRQPCPAAFRAAARSNCVCQKKNGPFCRTRRPAHYACCRHHAFQAAPPRRSPRTLLASSSRSYLTTIPADLPADLPSAHVIASAIDAPQTSA